MFALFWLRDPTPPLFGGEGGCLSGTPVGEGYPTFVSLVNDRHPLQGTHGGTPVIDNFPADM
ncbi:MAG: hypothetical protein STSR0009_26780 [Methanoregula sp.]